VPYRYHPLQAAPVFDKVVFSKIKEKLGGRVKLVVSGEAPAGREGWGAQKACCGMNMNCGACCALPVSSSVFKLDADVRWRTPSPLLRHAPACPVAAVAFAHPPTQQQ